MAEIDNVLEVKDLETVFYTNDGIVKAVNGASFALPRGSVLALVGESGSGKTVTALSLMQLVPYPGRIVGGSVLLEGREILGLDTEQVRRLRGKEMAMIFQDPLSGLNPVLPIGEQVEEIITTHLPVGKAEARARALQMLSMVGLPSPEELVSQYPFQLSGGMGQRVMIAIAMALQPKVLIADEPTSALDVTVQAQILAELRFLKEKSQLSVLLITHDLGVVAQIADEVAVVYAGSIVERTDTISLFKRPGHPYTAALLASLPRLDNPGQQLHQIPGSPPSLIDLPDQCPFLPRCNRATNECRNSSRPSLRAVEPGHEAACYHPIRYDWAQVTEA